MLYLLSQSHLMYKRSIFQNHMQPFFQFVFKYDLRIGEKQIPVLRFNLHQIIKSIAASLRRINFKQ